MTASGDARPSLQFGISVTPYADQYPQIVEQVRAAERGWLELVGIQDHPYQRRFLDTFALIGDLLARTSRIRIFPDVASLPMRPPAMIAKAAASLDVMSAGRFELGLGGGTFWDAVGGMGGTVRQGGEVLPALEEAIDIIRAALDVGAERRVVRSPGPYHAIPGYPPGPAPAHRIEIWLGAMKPGALRLIGRKADGWIPGGGISQIADFARLSAVIDDAATEAGRDPETIRRIANVGGVPVGQALVDLLVHLAGDLRFAGIIWWPPDGSTAEIERFAAEIVPSVREAVTSTASR
jgi:alkanesulfonate monooxygenase SsuD/methylene tetrahydromethanopterin reductase-like flavin-dependent oxidoreductase (luciferase family)